MRIAITGSTGLIGGALARSLRTNGATVIAVGRTAAADIRWDPERPMLRPDAFDGLDAVVHLAGAQIGQRWTAARRREIWRSRVDTTLLVAKTIAASTARPPVLVCGSAVGFYGDRGDESLTEDSARGTGFLADVVDAWEAAARPARDAGVRVVSMRAGVVISRDGGVLARLLTPFRLGLGGPIGTGRQWMSWVGLPDLVRMLRFAINGALEGPVNASSPAPVTNAEFAATLGRVLHRPAIIPVPAFALRAAFGAMARETLLASQRALPERLERAGFVFETGTLDAALRQALGA